MKFYNNKFYMHTQHIQEEQRFNERDSIFVKRNWESQWQSG